MAASHLALLLLPLLLLIWLDLTTAQTFHYSNAWRAGKRASEVATGWRNEDQTCAISSHMRTVIKARLAVFGEACKSDLDFLQSTFGRSPKEAMP
nr:gonadotropin-releasing hormone-1 [Stylochoplana pusilla]